MGLPGQSEGNPDSKQIVAPAPATDVPVLKYGLGYFDEIKERNSEFFRVDVARCGRRR